MTSVRALVPPLSLIRRTATALKRSPAGGHDYASLLAARVLRPLGLYDTDCGGTAPDGSCATGYWHGRPRPQFSIPGMPAAGAGRASVRDLLTFTKALLAPDDATQHTARPGLLRAALRDAVRPPLATRHGTQTSLIWNIRPRRDNSRVHHHSGGTRGPQITGVGDQYGWRCGARVGRVPAHPNRSTSIFVVGEIISVTRSAGQIPARVGCLHPASEYLSEDFAELSEVFGRRFDDGLDLAVGQLQVLQPWLRRSRFVRIVAIWTQFA